MEQTNNSKLRTEYNQKIIETEQQINVLTHTKRQLQDLSELLEGDLVRDLRNLQNLNQELVSGGTREASWFQEDLTDRQRKLKQYLQQKNQEFNQECFSMTEQLNEERIQFQEERNKLPWD